MEYVRLGHSGREMLPMCRYGRRLRPVLAARQGQTHPALGHPDRSAVDVVAKSFDLDVDQPVVDAVQRVAESRGIPMSQVALAWLLAEPVVLAPIVGAH